MVRTLNAYVGKGETWGDWLYEENNDLLKYLSISIYSFGSVENKYGDIYINYCCNDGFGSLYVFDICNVSLEDEIIKGETYNCYNSYLGT